VGVNALTPGRAYLNLGTAVVSGTFTKNYITDRSFRTMACCADEGYYCETSLRSGTFLIDWFIQQMLKIDTNHNLRFTGNWRKKHNKLNLAVKDS